VVKRLPWMAFIVVAVSLAQDAKQGTNSFFDDSQAKEYAVRSILVEGEVENPGTVDLTQLPLRSVPIKDISMQAGKPSFQGAFYYSGYSLYDILDGRRVKKAAENTFSPLLDMYVVVENSQGEKAVFSWGEIYYVRDNHSILIARNVQAINPSKLQSVQWPPPGEPRLICSGDLMNARHLGNPTRIVVRSFRGTFATQKPANIYAPEFTIVMAGKSINVGEMSPAMEKRKYRHAGYGHGTGFKGIEEVTGVLLKDVLDAKIKTSADDLRQGIAVISAKDGYRGVFSLSELLNRNDNREFLLLDRKGIQADGRYVLFAAPDFFVDRNVKAIEKIEIVRVQ